MKLQALLVDTICTARRSGHRVSLPKADWSALSLADGYHVQGLVAHALNLFPDGHPPAWKLGGDPHSGPATAPVPGNAILTSPWCFQPGYAVDYGIEAEIAVRLGQDLPAGATQKQMLEAIESYFPCVELCDIRFDTDETIPPALQRADQQFNRALILGYPVSKATLPDWAKISLRLEVNGNTKFAGTGCHPFLNPLYSLPWLANHAAKQWDGLHAGDIIATGTWSGIYWRQPGESIRVVFENFGEVTMI